MAGSDESSPVFYVWMNYEIFRGADNMERLTGKAKVGAKIYEIVKQSDGAIASSHYLVEVWLTILSS